MTAGKKTVEPRSTGTDWKHMRREAAADAPIASDAAIDSESRINALLREAVENGRVKG